MVNETAGRILAQLAPAGDLGAAEPAPVNILLVDDEPTSLTALEALLTAPDRRLAYAGSGPEALRHLLRDDFAVVLLDVHMPGMDGFETAELIRQRERSRDTPLIFLTGASRGETFVAKGYALGAVDYILKPVDPTILRAKVAAFVELFRTARQIRWQADRLAETTAFLDSVLEGATEYAILALDSVGRLLTWNEGARRIYGYAEADMIGRATLGRLHPAPAGEPDPIEALLAAARRGERVEAELDGVRRDGRRFRAALTVDRRRDAGGGPAGFVAIARDVTDLKRAEEERAQLIREQAARAEAERSAVRTARLQTITAALSEAASPAQVAAAAVRQSLTTLGAQAGAVALLAADGDDLEVIWAEGYAPERLAAGLRFPTTTARPLAEAARDRRVVAVGSSKALTARYGPTAAAGVVDVGEERAWACLPLLAGERAIGAMLLSFAEPRTFTAEDEDFLLSLGRQCGQAFERAQLYAAERAARATAEAALRARDEFLAIAAHELKNPVAGIKGSADLLRRSQQRGILDDDRLERFLGNLGRGADRLARMVDDLLDVARLQGGQLPLRREPVDLAALLRDQVARLKATADGRALQLEIVAVPSTTAVDPDRLEQVVANLIGNAVKYSPDGGAVHVTLDRDDGGAVIAVRDEGIGLPTGAAAAIFEPFGRAPNAIARNLPGLGLGLYVCRRIIESHGGRIWAESQGEGCGTIVCIWLPTEPSAEVTND